MQLERRQMSPPYRPPLDGDYDLQNFDPVFTDEVPTVTTPTEDP